MIDERTLKIMGTVDVTSAGACETVEIVSVESPTGRVTINKSDLTDDMELFTEK